MGRGRKTKRCPPAANFLYLELDDPIMNSELQRECRFSEVRVHCLDPFFKPLGVEAGHVANQYRMNELSDYFALTLGSRMHSGHAWGGSTNNAPKVRDRASDDRVHAVVLPSAEFEASVTVLPGTARSRSPLPITRHFSLITLAVRHRSLARERSFSLGQVASPPGCRGHNYRTNGVCRFSGASLVRIDRKQKLLLPAF